MNSVTKTKIALMTFSDPRHIEDPIEREKYIKHSHEELRDIIISNDFEVIDPHAKIKNKNNHNFGFDNNNSVKEAANFISESKSDILIIECFHWSEPQLANLAVKYVNIPTIVYTKKETNWAGSIYFGAVCATLTEVPVNKYAKYHARVFEDMQLLLRYINAYSAYSRLKKSAILLFGGSYSLNMPFLRDDLEYLKSFLIEEIYEEEQYLIIKKAKNILRNDASRIEKNYKWLIQNNVKIKFDNKMLSENILKKQIALYLSVKDILKEYPDNVIGISLKCQPVLSEYYGVTGCMIPTFLPFKVDAEGYKKIYSTVCEGDIKGLLTCCLLQLLTKGKPPPLFGDLKSVGDGYIIISNCGGSSAYYSANTNNVKKALNNLTISPQCQGKAGGAFGYIGKKFLEQETTVARLIRKDRQYVMNYFKGQSIDVNKNMIKKIGFGKSWPHVAVSTKKSAQEFAENVASNHYCLIPGDYIFEIEKVCQLFEIDRLKL